MKQVSATICCILWFIISAPAQQPGISKTGPKPAKPQLISNITLETAQQIIQEMGFKCTRDTDENGVLKTYFIFKAEGYKVGVEVPTPNFIWMYNVFTDPATNETINEWNQKNRFSRAYIATDKNLYLDTEIVTEGGVTRDNIETQVEQFRNSVAKWARFVVDHEKTAPPPAK